MDGYMGSGVGIKRAVKKYGRDNFKKEIVSTFNTPEEMYEFEELLVSEILSDRQSYNMRSGGIGNSSEDSKRIWTDERRQKHRDWLASKWDDGNYRNKNATRSKTLMAKTMTGRKVINDGTIERRVLVSDLDNYITNGWVLGRLPFSEDTKQRMRLSQIGKTLSVETRQKIASALKHK